MSEGLDNPIRGPHSTTWNTAHLVQKMRNEKPLCRVCGTPCDPDAATITVLMVPVDQVGDTLGLIPVHADGMGPGGRHCEAEARDRLGLAQQIVEARTLRQNGDA